jgi:hypothetical protein
MRERHRRSEWCEKEKKNLRRKKSSSSDSHQCLVRGRPFSSRVAPGVSRKCLSRRSVRSKNFRPFGLAKPSRMDGEKVRRKGQTRRRKHEISSPIFRSTTSLRVRPLVRRAPQASARLCSELTPGRVSRLQSEVERTSKRERGRTPTEPLASEWPKRQINQFKQTDAVGKGARG